jgi:hypothetical protein
VTSGTLFSICRARGATATLWDLWSCARGWRHHDVNTMRVSERVHGHSLLSVVYIAWDGDPVAERQQDDDPTS